MQKWIPIKNELHLRRFGKLGEELGELQAVVSRCIIQGIDEVDPSTGTINRIRLHDEISDVLAQIHCTIETFGLSHDYISDRKERKITYMAQWDKLVNEGE
jgi:NTP pyrophosphatase (non-canonical NTP hydrolase)